MPPEGVDAVVFKPRVASHQRVLHSAGGRQSRGRLAGEGLKGWAMAQVSGAGEVRQRGGRCDTGRSASGHQEAPAAKRSRAPTLSLNVHIDVRSAQPIQLRPYSSQPFGIACTHLRPNVDIVVQPPVDLAHLAGGVEQALRQERGWRAAEQGWRYHNGWGPPRNGRPSTNKPHTSCPQHSCGQRPCLQSAPTTHLQQVIDADCGAQLHMHMQILAAHNPTLIQAPTQATIQQQRT